MFGFGLNQYEEYFIMQSDINRKKLLSNLQFLNGKFTSEEMLLECALDNCNLQRSDFTDIDWQNILDALPVYVDWE